MDAAMDKKTKFQRRSHPNVRLVTGKREAVTPNTMLRMAQAVAGKPAPNAAQMSVPVFSVAKLAR